MTPTRVGAGVPVATEYDDGIPEVRTERLVLRPWRHSDEAAFAAMCGDPLVTRYIDDGLPLPAADSHELLGRIRDHWRSYGFGLWPVMVASTGAWAGCVGLRYVSPRSAPAGAPGEAPDGEVEACWWLPRHAWGQGIATEAAAAAMRWGFEVLGVTEILAMCHHRNEGSIAVASRLGMTHATTMRSNRGWAMEIFQVARKDAAGPE